MRKASMSTRRAFLGIGALAGLSVFCSSWGEPLAQAGTITSWDYSANEELSVEAIADRFDVIGKTYEVGMPLSEEDADFVLRYALPSPVGVHVVQTSVAVSAGDAHEYQVQGSSTFKYCGNYVYRSDTTLQAGSSVGESGEICIQVTQLVFGYSFPPKGASLSIIGLLEHGERTESRDWFTVGESDEFVGVAVASWQSCQATISTADGDEVELAGVFS